MPIIAQLIAPSLSPGNPVIPSRMALSTLLSPSTFPTTRKRSALKPDTRLNSVERHWRLPSLRRVSLQNKGCPLSPAAKAKNKKVPPRKLSFVHSNFLHKRKTMNYTFEVRLLLSSYVRLNRSFDEKMEHDSEHVMPLDNFRPVLEIRNHLSKRKKLSVWMSFAIVQCTENYSYRCPSFFFACFLPRRRSSRIKNNPEYECYVAEGCYFAMLLVPALWRSH